MQQVIFIVYIFLLTVLKPYKDNRLNILDVAIFTNMALINILSWYTVETAIQTDLGLPRCHSVVVLHQTEGASAKMKKWRDNVRKRLHSIGLGTKRGLRCPGLLHSTLRLNTQCSRIERSHGSAAHAHQICALYRRRLPYVVIYMLLNLVYN